MTETFTAKINEIKEDVKGTLHTLKELKHDRSPNNSWTDDYIKVVMENQMWLIEKLESIRAEKVFKIQQENTRLREALEFYADEENWIGVITSIGNFPGKVEKDQGDKARQALGANQT